MKTFIHSHSSVPTVKKTFILILFLLYFVPTASFAADISFSADNNIFAQNEEFLVQVFLDTKDVKVNALEGTVVFPLDLLELKEIRDGNSSINFWIEKPHSVTAGKVAFSGITTGGFSGPHRFLFGLVLEAKKVGSSSISFDNIKVLQNDGLGTKIPITETPFTFSISKESTGSVAEDLVIKDTDPPENFNPFIANDSTIFDGKYFLVFSTVDKGAGIDHYEVREGFWNKYVTVESPHLLEDQSLSKNIYIKAIDKSGNERLVKIEAQNPSFWFRFDLILGILLVVCIFSYIFYRKKIWSKFTQ